MKERFVHEFICQWLRLTYPRVLFRSDFGAGLHMTWGQAMRQKKIQAGRAWPDLFIAEPRRNYHGLFIELKGDDQKVFKRDGTLRKNEHLAEQAETLDLLRTKGYMAEFACGTDQARSIISNYLRS